MTSQSLTFDAVAEPPGPDGMPTGIAPGLPTRRGSALGWGSGPTLGTVRGGTRRAHARLAPVHRQLARLAGDGDRAARLLSTWCPPP